MIKTKIEILLLTALLSLSVSAQVQSPVRIINADQLDLPPSFWRNREMVGLNFLNDVMTALYNKGYLLASWKETGLASDTLLVVVEQHELITWAGLLPGQTDVYFLQGAGIRPDQWQGRPVRPEEIAKTMQSILAFAENHGYPFASVRLCNHTWSDSVLVAELCLDLNRFIAFDTIQVLGNALLSANYLEQFTGISAGEPYNESLLRKLDAALDELPFIKRTQPSVVRFSGAEAKPVVYIDERNANQFDFIVGFLPNNEITGRLIVTGQGNLQLHNSFGQGEQLRIQFSKLESSTKSLNADLLYPYLPRLPLGIDAGFQFFLKDSTFLERDARLGLLYTLSGSTYIKGQVSFYNSDVLFIDTAFILATRVLPAEADIRTNTYGLEFMSEQLDYKLNPRKGWAIRLSGNIGRKMIRENQQITGLTDPFSPEFDFSTLYDSIELNSMAVDYQYDLQWFQPLGNVGTVLIRGRGAANLNQELFSNELYRIGGNTLLRGFDELSMFVSEYHILSLETRYLLSKNSFAGLFTDIGYTVDRSLNAPFYDQPFGFGAMITFETKAGIFGLTYALGGTDQNPVLIRNAKIHFGYINYF
jgi:outer membrane protein assembly factor BamA